MLDSASTSEKPRTRVRWEPVDAFTPGEAIELARTARISRSAERDYMSAHIVSEATAEQEIRRLLERILQTGRLARECDGPLMRARTHKADGDDAWSFLLDPATKVIVGYRGPASSWFDEVHPPIEELLDAITERRRRDEEIAQRRLAREREAAERRASHEKRMAEQQAAAARRASAVPAPTWPLMPEGLYDWSGNPALLPSRRRPITDEARIRRAGRLPHVVFHSEALNSPFFRDVPLENRCEAVRRVLDKLLRAPTKGAVSISPDCITVSGQKVVLTLTPDCTMVRTLNPPRPGDSTPARYRAERWRLPRPKSTGPADPEADTEPKG
ncbi:MULTISPECIES: hypothetical protein [unclassified Streptomyces]|uniref:Uncharacterized protein n=1 Tax=Streptomyces sp. F12 TaxID=1436084 RepID=V9ZAL4_9ACTN|nr:hypothetical protein [Streptomyces sp. F12]AHE40476.1 hypothetical protein pFRL6_389c [Streptomyces sp. F12]